MTEYEQYIASLPESEQEYARRVEAYIVQGMSRGDAQGVVEAEMMQEY